MTAPHLFASDVGGDRIEITGEDARHAVRVLRLRPGERITISDGAGGIVDAVITAADKTLVADVDARRFVERLSPALTVVQAIPKGSKFDEIVQHLTELGVDEIVPLRAKRSVARWEGEAKKLERLRVIAREAAKQSHRAWLPRIADVTELGGIEPHGVLLVLHEEAELRLSAALPTNAPERISIFVGPEGGFDSEEVALLVGRGAVPVTLGPQILRTETAAIVAGTLVLGAFGRLG